MNKDTHEMLNRLLKAGISWDDACALRRISMTLHRWHEFECGTGDDKTTYSIERETDEPDSKPFMRIQYPTREGYVDKRYPIADRENGALRRLRKIMGKYATLGFYVQGDCRGAALYILRPGDVPKGERADAFYSNGIAVFK